MIALAQCSRAWRVGTGQLSRLVIGENESEYNSRQHQQGDARKREREQYGEMGKWVVEKLVGVAHGYTCGGEVLVPVEVVPVETLVGEGLVVVLVVVVPGETLLFYKRLSRMGAKSAALK
ncbi:hypothetical protein FOCC_FOCC006631 [Frankliniella occidentalis]|nr:hypothetical protein FOCC_FOCC006631 [Frankliniella occidentalis]